MTNLSEHADAGPVIRRRPLADDHALDMMPMIDVTFLLLIFFLVSSVPDVRAALDLPPAEHGVGIAKRSAVVISVARADDGPGVAIYLSDVKSGEPLSGTRAEQEAAIRRAVEQALLAGATEVLIQAEQSIRHRDVARVMRAAAVAGASINTAVMEMD